MFVSDCLEVNEKGHLTIGGCDTVELAERFQTPLYVMDEATIRNACRLYKSSFEKYYGGNGTPCFASKALNCLEICRIIKEEGLGLDVVSGGELYTALKAGFPVEKIHFHGNNKTDEEIDMALRAKVGRIVLDNLYEIDRINDAAKRLSVRQEVSMRIKPGVDAHTHSFIRTGQIDSKFGFALETGEALEAVKMVQKADCLTLKEVHCHIGSQIFDLDPFVHTAEVMMDFIGAVKNETGYVISSLNLGGGFGIKYTEEDSPNAYDNYMKAVSETVKQKAKEYSMDVPYVYIEPGRSIVGEAGITLYRVGGIKEIPNIRTYVSVDGGMTDNPRYALYGSSYSVLLANKADKPQEKKVTVAGRCCESGDLIQENVMIQSPEVGDIMAVLSTGAYNYSMASNYNRVPRPAMVMIRDKSPRVIIRRETYDDLIKNDL